MNKRNQNSIIALATLGVYLGLLLAGATPGVLAQQAALTKQFNVNDEIERKDDLDKNPDETNVAAENFGSRRFSEFATAYAEFVLDEYGNELEFAEKMSKECPDVCRLSYLSYFTTFAPTLEKFFKISDYSGGVEWVADTMHREMEIEYCPSQSELSGLQAAFAVQPTRKVVSSRPLELIIRNSTVSVESKNRHLIIVTRLPRGSLDKLLATDAK